MGKDRIAEQDNKERERKRVGKGGSSIA